MLDDVPNQAFPLTFEAARQELRAMRESPGGLSRPVVVLSGWRAINMLPRNLIANLAPTVAGGPAQFEPVAYPWETNFEANAQAVVQAVERRWPSASTIHTTEVDAIGVSMGGLVARVAAMPAGWACPMPVGRSEASVRKRLKIKRLFTIGSPHRGAWLADRFPIDPAARKMRSNSLFLRRLDEGKAEQAEEMLCYARLHDEFVGATKCAPAGEVPYWLGGLRVLSHLTIAQDPRILADIARRLRGEAPLAGPGTPPPRD